MRRRRRRRSRKGEEGEGNDDDDDGKRGRNVQCNFFGSGFPVMQWHIPEERNHKINIIYILTSKSDSLKL